MWRSRGGSVTRLDPPSPFLVRPMLALLRVSDFVEMRER